MIFKRKLQMRGQVRRRIADGDHRAAILNEFFDLWQRLLHRNAAQMAPVLRGNVLRRFDGAATPTGAALPGDSSSYEDQHIEPAFEIASVERGSEDALEREFELF